MINFHSHLSLAHLVNMLSYLRTFENWSLIQPHSQGLSSLPPLSRWNRDPGFGWSRDHRRSRW